MANIRGIYFRHMCKRQARKLAVLSLIICAGSLSINLIYTKNFKSSIQTKSVLESLEPFPFIQDPALRYHNVSLTRATQAPKPRQHPEHPNRSLFKTLELPPVPVALDERSLEVIAFSHDDDPPPQRAQQSEAKQSRTKETSRERLSAKQSGFSPEGKTNKTLLRKGEAKEADLGDLEVEDEPEPRAASSSKGKLSSAGEDLEAPPPARKQGNESGPAKAAKRERVDPGAGAGAFKVKAEEDEYEEYDGDSPNDFRDTVFDNEIMRFAASESGGLKQPANASSLCPDKSPYLLGSLAGSLHDITKEELMGYFPYMEKGGRLRPLDCVPKQRLAIIIPYRNRYPHLHIALHNLVPLLKRQQADATFFVIDQAPPSTFNRGALLNIGFLEAEKRGNFDCYIFHDVDLIPLHDHNMYRCGPKPRHYAVAINKYKFKLPYPSYFGGVVGFSKEQYLKVNGNSNLYIGWGGEDDDLLRRLKIKRYLPDRYPVNISRYHMIKHTRDKGNEANPLRKAILKSALQRQDVEGLNTVRYEVLNVTLDRLYTWITVSINTTEILMTAPLKTLSDVEEARKTWQREKAKKEKEAAEVQRRRNLALYNTTILNSSSNSRNDNSNSSNILDPRIDQPPPSLSSSMSDKAPAPSSSDETGHRNNIDTAAVAAGRTTATGRTTAQQPGTGDEVPPVSRDVHKLPTGA